MDKKVVMLGMVFGCLSAAGCRTLFGVSLFLLFRFSRRSWRHSLAFGLLSDDKMK